MAENFDVRIGGERFTGVLDTDLHGSGARAHTHLGQALDFLARRGGELRVTLPDPIGALSLSHAELATLDDLHNNSLGDEGRIAHLRDMLGDASLHPSTASLTPEERSDIARVILGNVDQAFATRGEAGLEARRRGPGRDVALDLSHGGDDAPGRLRAIESPDTAARPERPLHGSRGASLRRPPETRGDAPRTGTAAAETSAVDTPPASSARPLHLQLWDLLDAARDGRLDSAAASRFLRENRDALSVDTHEHTEGNVRELDRRLDDAVAESEINEGLSPAGRRRDAARHGSELDGGRADVTLRINRPDGSHIDIPSSARLTSSPEFLALPPRERQAVLATLDNPNCDLEGSVRGSRVAPHRWDIAISADAHHAHRLRGRASIIE